MTKKVDDQLVMELYAKNVHPRQIAKRVNMATGTVYRVLKRNGIQLDPTPDKIEVDAKAVARSYAERGSLLAVGRQFGVSRAVVARRVEREGGRLKNQTSQLRVAEIVRAYQNGTSCAELARQKGVSWGTINKRLLEAGIRQRITAEARRVPPGTLRWNRRAGYVSIKDTNGKWRPAARVIWERAHGEVKQGCSLIRIDAGLPPTRIDGLDNLAVVTTATTSGRRWAKGRIDTDQEEPTRREMLRCIVMIAALKAGDTDLKFGTSTEPETTKGQR